MKNSIFISVGWSVALRSTILAIVFFTISFFVFKDHLTDQIQQKIQLTSQRDYNQFEQLRRSSSNFQLGFIEAIAVTLRSLKESNLDSLTKTIENNWETFNLIYGLEKLSIYSNIDAPDYSYGDIPINYPNDIMTSITMDSEPFSIFLCNQGCYHVVGVPFLLGDNTPVFIILAAQAETLIAFFNNLTGAKATMVHLDANQGLILIGDDDLNQALQESAQFFNTQRAWNFEKPIIYQAANNQFYNLSIRKVSDHRHLADVYLFWSLDITPLILRHQKTLGQSILVMIGLGIILFFFMFFSLRNFSARSQLLAETLPLLTQAKYKEAEQQLKPPTSFLPFEDDIDRLFDTSLTVTQQLQRMNEEIDLQNQRLHKMAYRDSLTGLPNRQSFYESLNQQLRLLSRRDKFLGLLFIDVDGFKPVNDTYGHKAGDFILTTLAVRVNNCIRQADTLFRLAGDEFVIIVSELEAEDGLHIIARKVVDSMHRPTSWEGHILDVSLSVGGVMTKNSDLHQDEFLHKADEAMYISKNTGKGKYTFLGIL